MLTHIHDNTDYLAVNRNRKRLVAAKSWFIAHHELNHVRFTRVESFHDYQQVMDLRVNIYQKNVPYMLTQISGSGSDEFDHRSYIYAAFYDDTLIASTRLTPFPFETSQYIDENNLSLFLGHHWKNHYLEWSRLLVDTSVKIAGITNALTIYAGLDILLTTHYTHYLGYTRPHVRRVFSKFQLENESLSFTIPNRGEHEYLLLKGNLMEDFEHFIKRFNVQI